MSYESSIKIIINDFNNTLEDEVYKSILNLDIEIDKEELIKALNNERSQYNKGYIDDKRMVIERLKTFILTLERENFYEER